MSAVTTFFLRARHWQVFILTWGFYFVGAIAIEILLPPVSARSKGSLRYSLLTEAIMLPFVLSFMAWLWSVGSFLWFKVKPPLRVDIIGFFRITVLYCTLYLLAASPLFLSDNSTMELSVLPLHLFAMFCLIYALYFVSKSLAVAEKRRIVTFRDYALYLFLLWFSPIGIWLIQPRINQFCTQQRRASPSPE